MREVSVSSQVTASLLVNVCWLNVVADSISKAKPGVKTIMMVLCGGLSQSLQLCMWDT